jgi:hypothetical protein
MSSWERFCIFILSAMSTKYHLLTAWNITLMGWFVPLGDSQEHQGPHFSSYDCHAHVAKVVFFANLS